MFPVVCLTAVTREDVQRVDEWLKDPELSSSWYGLGDGGVPLHIGYVPWQLLQATEDEWRQVFDNDDRRIYSVYTNEGDHIGEGQLIIEWNLLEASTLFAYRQERPLAPTLRYLGVDRTLG